MRRSAVDNISFHVIQGSPLLSSQLRVPLTKRTKRIVCRIVFQMEDAAELERDCVQGEGYRPNGPDIRAASNNISD